MENILRYNQPAQNFNEALPLGNGFLGAMVYGQIKHETISLNLDSLWSGKPGIFIRDGAYETWKNAQTAMREGRLTDAEEGLESGFAGPFTQTYLPLGKLLLEYDTEEPESYIRELDMGRGLARVSCDGCQKEYLISNPYRCMAIRMQFRKKTTVKVRLQTELQAQSSVHENIIFADGVCPIECRDGHEPVYGEGGTHFAMSVCAVVGDGQVLAGEDALELKGIHRAVLYFSAESSFVNHRNNGDMGYAARVRKTLATAIEIGYSALRREQIRYYRAHYGNVVLSLNKPQQSAMLATDERLLNIQNDLGLVELLFNFGRYLTVAASAPGSQATNLQGIWNEDLHAIWRSNYTVNINTEMNYWHTMMCGMDEFMQPLIGFVKKLSDTGREVAQRMYHAPGFVCHHNVDLWGHAAPVGGMGEEFIPGNSNFSFWSGASGWLCRSLFEYYEYTGNDEFLRNEAYPIFRAAAEFYLHILEPVGERMAIFPAASPENQYLIDGKIHAVTSWTAMSQSICLDLFKICAKTCDILKTDAEWKDRLLTVCERLKPFEVDSRGRLLEWDQEYTERDVNHRHPSHLYGLFPAELITMRSAPDLAQACRRSLEARGDEGTGWSLAYKICLWAKLKEGDHALSLIQRQLQMIESTHTSCELWGGGTYPNLLCAHPPFQIDGNFGAVAGIAMLFLQCEDGIIKVLPALPSSFSSGFVYGLRAKGRICVNIEWTPERVDIVLKTPVEQSVTLEVEGQLQACHCRADKRKHMTFFRDPQKIK